MNNIYCAAALFWGEIKVSELHIYRNELICKMCSPDTKERF